jgi:hypothetical protein
VHTVKDQSHERHEYEGHIFHQKKCKLLVTAQHFQLCTEKVVEANAEVPWHDANVSTTMPVAVPAQQQALASGPDLTLSSAPALPAPYCAPVPASAHLPALWCNLRYIVPSSHAECVFKKKKYFIQSLLRLPVFKTMFNFHYTCHE